VRAAIVLCLLPAVSPLAAQELKALYRAHRWFELRDAVPGKEAPAFYRGAAASAFHRPEAEELLLGVIRHEPHSDDTLEAHKLLMELYWRAGRFPEALEHLKEVQRTNPEYRGGRNTLAAFEAFAQGGEQVVARRGPSRLRYQMAGNNLVVPVSVNGKPANYILDTDFNICGMSESEARRLGLAVREANARASGQAAAGSAPIRAAIVREIAVGEFRIRNVAFTVHPDTGQPWADLPEGERGIIGLPVILAPETLRWNKEGEIEIGVQVPEGGGPGNLWLDGVDPVTQVGFGRDRLDMILDTGAEATQMWNRFAVEYAGLVRDRGEKSSETVTGVGGSKEFGTVRLPELTLRVGGLDTLLRPAEVFPKVIGRDRLHGAIGMDLLRQARRVTIDFHSMAVTLE